MRATSLRASPRQLNHAWLRCYDPMTRPHTLHVSSNHCSRVPEGRKILSQLFLLPRLESPKNRHNLRPFCRILLAAILLLSRLHGGLADVPPLACREPPAPLTRLP